MLLEFEECHTNFSWGNNITLEKMDFIGEASVRHGFSTSISTPSLRLPSPDFPQRYMARRHLLEFEKPLVELEQQIEQVPRLARSSEVDVSQQLLQLETLPPAAERRSFQPHTGAENSGGAASPSAQHPGLHPDVL